MPLVELSVPLGPEHKPPAKEHQHHLPESEVLSDYEDLLVDNDMDGEILSLPAAGNNIPPALPQRSQKRVSRLLDNVMVELQNLDGKMPVEEKSESLDPHEWYLSSEEDGSLSGDEDLDSEVEFGPPSVSDGEALQSRSSRSSSLNSEKDITVRTITFKPAGKPRIIDIPVRGSPVRKHPPITSFSSMPTGTNFSDLWEPAEAAAPSWPPAAPAPLRLSSSSTSLPRQIRSSTETAATEPSKRMNMIQRRASKVSSLSLRRTGRLSFKRNK